MRRSARLEDADYVVCTGLFDDEIETPDDYRDLLGAAARAQPVHDLRQSRTSWSSAATSWSIARARWRTPMRSSAARCYYAGKPHRPLYDLALGESANARAARALGDGVALDRVLAIGDLVRTDLKGAHDLGVDCLFVTAGIHAEELGHRDDPDLAALGEMFAAAGEAPKAVTRKLMW